MKSICKLLFLLLIAASAFGVCPQCLDNPEAPEICCGKFQTRCYNDPNCGTCGMGEWGIYICYFPYYRFYYVECGNCCWCA
jgi:hypothetical protein